MAPRVWGTTGWAVVTLTEMGKIGRMCFYCQQFGYGSCYVAAVINWEFWFRYVIFVMSNR